ncbi:hypothetical protein D3C78_1657040 [compost metagenome]
MIYHNENSIIVEKLCYSYLCTIAVVKMSALSLLDIKVLVLAEVKVLPVFDRKALLLINDR